MAISVHFGHITDVHLSDRDHSWSTVVSMAPQLLRTSLTQLNQVADLDFVLLTGDLLDTATRSEVEQVNQIVPLLNPPWHFVPGNHDGFIDPGHPDALRPEEAVMLIDPRLGRERVPQAQRSYWSRSARPGVQLIGLDSRLAEDWSGTIDAQQFGWLEGQLESHTADLIILAVHHPLHALGPHNLRGRFPKFICDNGAQVEALLDRHPNVKVVLSGHHHANHLSLANGGRRLHVCTTALSGYRCLYRTIRLTQVSGGWRAQVASHNIGDAATHQVAYQAAQQNGLAREFDPADPAAWPDFCAGRPEDLTFDAVLP